MNAPDSRLDVIVPARDEAATIQPCLRALLLDAEGLRLRVAVVLNGERAEETAACIAPFQVAFAEAGHELIIARSEPGKAEALNVGDTFRRGCPVVYLDADAIVLPGALRQFRQVLAEDPQPRLAAPRIHLAEGRSAIARSVGRAWSALPKVREGIVGGGCYAVNAAGRRLWTRFPDISGDDAFVCGLFPPDRRMLLPLAGILISFPDRWGALIAQRTRWLRSGREGAKAALAVRRAQEGPTAASFPQYVGQSRWAALRSPGVLASLPAYAAVYLAARILLLFQRIKATSARSDWRPQRTAALAPVRTPGFMRPRVRVVVVAHNNSADIAACLGSLRSQWATLEILVVDNASTDATAAHVARFSGARLITSKVNLGFAAAVNRATRDLGDVDHVLLMNPDAILDPGAIDRLLALAICRPFAGLFGGRGRQKDGRANAASCLGPPSLRRAILFATGLGSGLAMPQSTYRDAFAIRGVPALSGACLLVTTEAWQALGGFDESFFLYGEDVDLCLRARCAGLRPTYAAMSGYVHDAGASSPSPVDRTCRVLAGTISLYRKYGGRLAGLLNGLIIVGVLLRVAGSTVIDDGRWPAVWRRRTEWRRGYGNVAPT